MSADISTTYMGLPLRSPVVAGSSGITDNVDNLKALEDAGVGAVVLKSLFEEEIVAEMSGTRTAMERPGPIFPETAEMDDLINDESAMSNYLELIQSAGSALDAPVIASINCTSNVTWPAYADLIERAGADAIELNVFLMPSNVDETDPERFEQTYFDVLQSVKEQVSIPVSLKVSYYFTLLARTLRRLSDSGADGLVLFNRFFNPDFDINTFRLTPANVLSSPELLHLALRWVAIMSERVDSDIAASTGVHDADGVIKQLLAGAQVAQIASVLYRQGIEVVRSMNARIESWMELHEFETIDDFRGRLSRNRVANPAAYERVQFVKNYRRFAEDATVPGL
jgi:dihydroorotate dehydrogenase (fumarate)